MAARRRDRRRTTPRVIRCAPSRIRWRRSRTSPSQAASRRGRPEPEPERCPDRFPRRAAELLLSCRGRFLHRARGRGRRPECPDREQRPACRHREQLRPGRLGVGIPRGRCCGPRWITHSRRRSGRGCARRRTSAAAAGGR